MAVALAGEYRRLEDALLLVFMAVCSWRPAWHHGQPESRQT
jgi:hypothetical protein